MTTSPRLAFQLTITVVGTDVGAAAGVTIKNLAVGRHIIAAVSTGLCPVDEERSLKQHLGTTGVKTGSADGYHHQLAVEGQVDRVLVHRAATWVRFRLPR